MPPAGWNTPLEHRKTSNPDDVERERVLELLRDVQLPDTLNIDVQKPFPGAEAVYDPEADTLLVPRGAPSLSILREGARAEYHRRANLVKALPADVNSRIGILLASAAYVGIRLAAIAGFTESEHGALSKLGVTTIGEWAAKYSSAADVRGTRSDGTPLGMPGFRGVLRLLPVVVAELENGEVVVGADLETAVAAAGDALRSIIAATVQLMRKEERLFDLDRLRALGKNSSDKLGALK